MIFERLEIQGFKSFKNKEVLSFKGNHSGLFFLTGNNQIEPSLGANGVGKSTIFDAVCFALFGKSSRGLKAGDVGSWGSKKPCEVVLYFYLNSEKVSLRRTWNPNSLLWCFGEDSKSWEEVSQDKLEQEIGFTFDSFLNSVLISQQGVMFLDMSAAEKTTLFSSVLGLDHWLTLSKKAKDSADYQLGFINDTTQDVSEIKGKIDELSLIDYAGKIAIWEEERKDKITLSKNRKFSASAELKKARDGLKVTVSKMEEVKALYQEAKAEVEVAKEDYEAAQQKGATFEATIAGCSAREKQLLKEAKRLEDNFSQGTCPTCGTAVDEAHLEKEFSRIEEELKEVDAEMSAARNSLQKRLDAAKKLRIKYNSCVETSEDIRSEFEVFHTTKTRQDSEIVSLTKEVNRIQIEIGDLEEALNPFEGEAKKRDDRVSQLKERLAELHKDLENSRKERVLTEYWIKGFKEVRMFLIEEALKQLEIEVNNSLQHLGLHDWKISFAMDEETKGGTIHKGFSVFVSSPYNNSKVRWESWSGGESQRLRLAGTMGLVNLILNRRGIPTNLEIWDEPSNFLSEQGIADLLDTLSERAIEVKKQIWIVDHRALTYSNFERTFTVVKDEQGSHLETEDY